MSLKLGKYLAATAAFLTPVRLAVVASAAVFITVVVMGDKGLYQLQRLMEMKKRLSTERIDLRNEIDALSAEKAKLLDPSKLEGVIRKDLRFIKPGEIVFETSDGRVDEEQ